MCGTYRNLGTKLTIDQIITQLENQKLSIDNAIRALKQVSDIPLAVADSAVQENHSRRRGRPPGKKQRATKRTRPTYSDDFRRQVVAAVRGGTSIGAAAKQYGVTWFTVREWVNSGSYEPEGGRRTKKASA